MTKVQHILNEMNLLNSSELEVILQELLKKINQEKRVKAILDEYKGLGKGIWKIDAQEYVNERRDNDRI